LVAMVFEGGFARHSFAVAHSFLALGSAKCSSAFVGVHCDNFLLKII